MPLYIRDEEVRELARRVAEARGTSVTETVKRALERELAALEGTVATRDAELRRLFAGFDTRPPRQDFSEADLYDEHGLPR
jgi:hypothetical protein